MSRWTLALLLACAGALSAQMFPPPPPPPPPNQPDIPKPGRPETPKTEAPKPEQTGSPKISQPELRNRQQQKAPTTGKEEIPPEEDKALSTEEFSFNPLEAEKWLSVGNYYFKTGKYRSAADRFKGATKWNDGLSAAWLRLGEVEEKLKDPQAARDAYTKYLEVAPEAKNAEQIRKKLEKLK